MEGLGRKNYRPGRLRLHILPILVWLGTAACVVMLFRYRTERFEVVGLAQGRVRHIAATCAGRLKEVPVQLFDQIKKGQDVAVIDTVLDNENIQAQLKTVRAEVAHLTAELAPARERIEVEAANAITDQIATQRRFAVDVESAGLRVLELTAQIETDKITLEDLAAEVEIVRDLLQQQAVADYELQKVEAKHNVVAMQIEQYTQLLAEAKLHLDNTQKRQQEFAVRQPQHLTVDNALAVITKAREVQQARMQELRAKRDLLILKSPVDGMVSLIQRGPGETVLPGDPILTVAETEPREIVTYATEGQFGQLRERMRVRLIKHSEPKKIADSQVVYLGPTMELMPERLWRTRGIPQWGRPVLIKIPPGMKLVPGELVGIKGL